MMRGSTDLHLSFLQLIESKETVSDLTQTVASVSVEKTKVTSHLPLIHTHTAMLTTPPPLLLFLL